MPLKDYALRVSPVQQPGPLPKEWGASAASVDVCRPPRLHLQAPVSHLVFMFVCCSCWCEGFQKCNCLMAFPAAFLPSRPRPDDSVSFNKDPEASVTLRWCEKKKLPLPLFGPSLQVEQFWRFYSHMVRPGDLTGHSDFHLFKEGIKPMWEVSEHGGPWAALEKKVFSLFFCFALPKLKSMLRCSLRAGLGPG